MVSMASDTAAAGDRVDKLSLKVGLSRESFQQWDYVMSQNGMSIETMQTGMKALTSVIDGAINGSSEAAAKFERLGISVDDLAGKSREDIFQQTIMGLQNISDEGERAAIASELFGRSATELAPLLAQTAEGTQALIDEAEKYGMIMSDEAVNASVAFGDSVDKMKGTLTGLKNRMVAEFLPSLTQVTDGLALLFTGDTSGLNSINDGIVEFVSNITNVIPKIMEIGGTILTSLANAIIQNLPILLTSATDIILSLVKYIVDALPNIIKAGLEVIISLAEGIADALPELIPTIVDVILEIVDILTDPENLMKLLDASIAIIIALAEGIIEALPKLLAKAPEIIVNLVTAIIQAVPKLLDAASKIITTLADGIAENFSKIVDKGKEIIDKVGDGIKQNIDDAKNWGKDLIANFISGITQKWEDLKTTVSNVAQTVKDFLGFSEPKKGPLSNFHTYAPDMMELFARGIKENEDLISKQFDSALSFSGANVWVGAATMGEANQRSIATQRDVMLNVGITTDIDSSAAMGLARYILPFIRVAEKEAFA